MKEDTMRKRYVKPMTYSVEVEPGELMLRGSIQQADEDTYTDMQCVKRYDYDEEDY